LIEIGNASIVKRKKTESVFGRKEHSLTHSEPVGVVGGWSVGQWKPICFLLLMKAAEGVHLVWMSASLSPVGTF
jgi:hypothetical protein